MTREDLGEMAIDAATLASALAAAVALGLPAVPGWVGAVAMFVVFLGLRREAARLGRAPAPIMAAQGGVGVSVTTPALSEAQAQMVVRETYAFRARLEALL